MTKDTDPDLRFMALNDLEHEIANPSISINSHDLHTYSETIFKGLDDDFVEVRTQSLKCFESIGFRLRSDTINLIQKLISVLERPKKVISITSSIYTMALHNLLKNLPNVEGIHSRIIAILLPEIVSNKDTFYVEIDYIEILTDLCEYLGKFMEDKQIMETLLFLNDSVFFADTIISKKSSIASSILIKNINDKEVVSVITNKTFENFRNLNSKKPFDSKLRLLPLLSAYINGNPTFIDNFILEIYEIVSDYIDPKHLDHINDDYEMQQNNDIIRIEAISVLIKLFQSCKGDIVESLIVDTLLLCENLIVYDPYNNNSNDDVEDNDGDTDHSDNFDDNYSDYEQDDDDNENDDDIISWKVRTEALALLKCIIENFPLKLPLIFESNFQIMLKSLLVEKNSNVVMKLIETLSLIFEFSIHDGVYYNLLNYKNMAEATDSRQNSDISMQFDDDPYSYLLENSFEICNSILVFYEKFSTDSVNNKDGLILKMISNLTNSLNGLDSRFIETFIITLNRLGNGIVSNPETFTFYSSFLYHGSIEDFGNGLEYLINYLKKCLSNDSNHKSVLEGLTLIDYIFENKFNDSNDINDKIATQFSNIFTDLLVARTINKNLSSEIRLKALNSLVTLCIHTEINKQTIEKLLSILNNALSTEVLSSNGLISIIKLLNSGKMNDLITSDWAKSILDLMLQYFNVSDLSLNSISVVSLLARFRFLDSDDCKKVLIAIDKLHIERMFTPSNCTNIGLILTDVIENIDASNNNLDKFISLSVDLNSFEDFDDILPKLMDNLLSKFPEGDISNSIQKFGNANDNKISKLLAVLSVASRNEGSIETILQNLSSGNNIYFSLVFLNQVSKSVDLNIGLAPFLEGFSSKEPNIIDMTIKVISTIVSKYTDKYLAEFLEYIKQTSYLKSSFKTLSRILDNIKISPDIAHDIFLLIIEIQRSNNETIKDYIEYSIAAECIGKLIVKYGILDSLFIIFSEAPRNLPALLLTSGETVKYTFNDSHFLKETDLSLLVDYADYTTNDYIFSSDLKFKETGVSNLNIILDKMPSVGISLINKMLPRIIETEIKPNNDYIHIQHIGIYKHKIDDGLNYRKQIFESVYYLLKSLEDNKNLKFLCDVNWSEYFNKFFNYGIKDDQSIVSISLLTTLKIFEQNPELFITKVENLDVFDKFIKRSRKMLNQELSDNAVKQDIEKQAFFVKMFIRFLKKTNKMIETNILILNGNQLNDWIVFVTETRAKFPIFNTED